MVLILSFQMDLKFKIVESVTEGSVAVVPDRWVEYKGGVRNKDLMLIFVKTKSHAF